MLTLNLSHLYTPPYTHDTSIHFTQHPHTAHNTLHTIHTLHTTLHHITLHYYTHYTTLHDTTRHYTALRTLHKHAGSTRTALARWSSRWTAARWRWPASTWAWTCSGWTKCWTTRWGKGGREGWVCLLSGLLCLLCCVVWYCVEFCCVVLSCVCCIWLVDWLVVVFLVLCNVVFYFLCACFST